MEEGRLKMEEKNQLLGKKIVSGRVERSPGFPDAGDRELNGGQVLCAL
jgi:hypothetical protein